MKHFIHLLSKLVISLQKYFGKKNTNNSGPLIYLTFIECQILQNQKYDFDAFLLDRLRAKHFPVSVDRQKC